MGGSSKPKQKVYDYLMSEHFGVCTGPVSFLSVKVDDRLIWTGFANSIQNISINNKNLFGGADKEGGVGGQMTILPGAWNQVLPDFHAQKLGRPNGANCPGFRGLASLFFTGFPGNKRRGFWWSTNSPYLRNVSAEVRRAPVGLNPAYALVPRGARPRSYIYFVIDNSDSMAGTRLATVKSAMNTVLDNIASAISGGGDISIGIAWFNTGTNSVRRLHASLSDVEGLRSFVNGFGTAYGTDFNVAMPDALDFFTDSLSDAAAKKRVMIFITDGEPVPTGSNTTAAHTIATMLDRASNPFSTAAGTAIDVFGINIELGDTSYTASIDNTPDDGVPVVSGSDPSGIVNAVNTALLLPGADANPAHMIYECLVDRSWGMGAPPSIIDYDSFDKASQTFYFENLGLSMIWTRQTSIEDFTKEILDHIQAVLFVDPQTGLITLRPLRADYDLDTLPVVTPLNATLTNFQRKAWGEIVNEIVVTWTNPANEQDETVTDQDIGSIATQGDIISDNRNYYGVRWADLAMRLARRDLRASATPLASCDAELDREFWDLTPGKVVKANWPEHGLSGVVMRVGEVDYGKIGEPMIKVSLMEDIFGLNTGNYVSPPSTGFVDVSADPTPITEAKIITLPHFLMAAVMSQSGLSIDQVEYPEVFAGVLASTDNADTINFDIYGPTVQIDGSTIQEVQGTCTVLGHATLGVWLFQEASTINVTFANLHGNIGPDQTVFVFIGDIDVADDSCEIAMISAVTDATYTLQRGMLDTTPKLWLPGTVVWFLTIDSTISDLDLKSDGETLTYKLLSRTSRGTLAPDVAPDLTGTLSGRPHYPTRPADVVLQGVHYWAVSVKGLSTVPASWANRNRLLEDAQVMKWGDATMTPETGQTTKIEILKPDRTVIATHSGLSGTSFNIPIASFGSENIGLVRFLGERDGHESLQGHEITAVLNGGYGMHYSYEYGGCGAGLTSGYGMDYGNDYGGT